MKNLFSPWRSHYIQSFKGDKPEGCVFCSAREGNNDDDTMLVYRGEWAFVLMNRFPYNSGHLMVIPNRHTADFQAFSTEESQECIKLLQVSQLALKELSRPHAFNIGMNLGRTAGAGIDDHLHWHIVPRWDGDTNFMPVLSDIKLVSEDMPRQWKELSELFPRLIGR